MNNSVKIKTNYKECDLLNNKCIHFFPIINFFYFFVLIHTYKSFISDMPQKLISNSTIIYKNIFNISYFIEIILFLIYFTSISKKNGNKVLLIISCVYLLCYFYEDFFHLLSLWKVQELILLLAFIFSKKIKKWLRK